MTDAVRQLFEMLQKKEKSGSDYTGKVTKVEDGVAYVQFDGSDIPNTPVALSIGCKAGDEVRVRVADGRAWITGNDTAPPTDDSVAQEVAEAQIDLRERITGLNGQYSELQRTADGLVSTVSDGDQLASIINQSAGSVLIQADKIQLSGYTKIDQGELGGFVSRKNDSGCAAKTTANDGHYYPTSLYQHSNDGTYEYEAGLRGSSSDSTHAAFFIRQMTAGDTWSNSSLNFYVRNDGYLFANNANIKGAINATSFTGTYTAGTVTMTATLSGAGLQLNSANTSPSQNYHVWLDPANTVWSAQSSISNVTRNVSINKDSIQLCNSGIGDYLLKLYASNGNVESWGHLYSYSGGGSYYTDIHGNSVDVYAEANGDDYTGDDRQGRFTASAAGNIGLYDVANSNYIIYSDSDTNVRVPHQFLCRNRDTSSTTVRVPVGSSNTSNNYVNWLGGTASSTLSINAQWSGSTFSTKTVAVSSSDIRLKDRIKDSAVDALYCIKQIPIRSFRWKEDDRWQRIGVIADELEQIDPMLVVGGGTDEDGNPIYKSVNNLLMISYLTKAVQQLSEKVDSLSAELASLREGTK